MCLLSCLPKSVNIDNPAIEITQHYAQNGIEPIRIHQLKYCFQTDSFWMLT